MGYLASRGYDAKNHMEFFCFGSLVLEDWQGLCHRGQVGTGRGAAGMCGHVGTVLTPQPPCVEGLGRTGSGK